MRTLMLVACACLILGACVDAEKELARGNQEVARYGGTVHLVPPSLQDIAPQSVELLPRRVVESTGIGFDLPTATSYEATYSFETAEAAGLALDRLVADLASRGATPACPTGSEMRYTTTVLDDVLDYRLSTGSAGRTAPSGTTELYLTVKINPRGAARHPPCEDPTPTP